MTRSEKNRANFRVAMESYKELESSGLLCSTDSMVILDRIKSKYKLSPYKWIKENR